MSHTDYKQFKEDEGITGYMLTWHQPYERTYSKKEAYEKYMKLSQKHPVNPFKKVDDLETASLVGKKMKKERAYVMEEKLFNDGLGRSS